MHRANPEHTVLEDTVLEDTMELLRADAGCELLASGAFPEAMN